MSGEEVFEAGPFYDGDRTSIGEFDQQHEWSRHEPATLRASLEQSVIDTSSSNKGR